MNTVFSLLILKPFKQCGVCIAALLMLMHSTVFAAQDNTAADDVALDVQLQQLKQELLALNRDLFILKEELLFPANTEVAIYLSLDIGEYFELDAVQVEIDGNPIASHLYTAKQLDALQRGGVQRVYLGNVKSGSHEVVAIYTGQGPNERDYRRAASLVFEKTAQPSYLELKIVDSEEMMQPEFSIAAWQ